MPVALDILLGDLVRGQEVRAQLGAVQLVRSLELHLQAVHERLVAAVRDHRVQIAERDQILQRRVVPVIGQQLAHELQTGPGTLERGRDVDERVHERGRERIRQPERLLVRSRRPLVRSQQYVPHLRPDPLDLGEGGIQLRGGLVVLRLEETGMGDLRKVAVLQRDRVEAAGGEPETVLDGGLGGAGDLLADQLAQVTLARDERDDRDGPPGVGPSTKFVILSASRETNFWSWTRLASHRISSSMKRMSPW